MEQYKCKECNSIFGSKKSLGGHMSSHNRGESYRLKRETEKSKLKRKNSTDPHICKYCKSEFTSGPKLGGHSVMCNMNPNKDKTINKISKKNTGKTASDKTKQKISESMKIAHKDGRAWNIGKSRWNNEKSYPEKFFEKVIKNEFINKNYECEYPIGIYSLDFAWVKLKKAIEIDGDQHERFDEYKQRDIKKDKLCSDSGWEILRIKWKDLFNNTKIEIERAKQFIHQ